jgi:hypothetical protein
MGLAFPLALAGLVLAAIPVLAHLLRQSDVPSRALPTVALLARAIAASRRRVRVVDPWLLALRIALVVVLAFAVAAPFTEREVAFGSGGLASVAIVIDDSMSMSRVEGAGSPFETARARATEAIEALPEGSEIAVVLAGSPARVAMPRTTDRAAASRSIEDLEPPGARGTALEEAIELAGRQLAGAAHSDRRILVLSDLAGRDDAEALLPPSGVGLSIEALGESAASNVAIASVDASEDPTLEGSLSVAVTLRSFDTNDESATVSIVHDGRVLASADVALADGGGRTTLRVLAPDDGDPTAEVRLEAAGDALALDDARGLLMRAPSATRVLLVDGDAEPLSRRVVAGGGASTRYVAQALALSPPSLGSVITHRTDVDAFVTGDDTADVIVLADVDLARADVATRVRAMVEAGAGLLVAAGEHVRPGASAMSELLPGRVTSVAMTERVGLVAGPAALDSRDQGLGSVRVQRALVIDPTRAEDVALAFPDGAPALLVNREHRVAMLALALDDSASDLPFHPGFVPLVLELAHVLSRPGAAPDAPFAPDTAPMLSVEPGTTRVEIVRPDHSVVGLEGDAIAAPIPLAQFTAPGAYRVRITSAGGTREETRSAFVVAPPIEESNLRRSADPTAVASGSSARTASTVRDSLAPWFFALAGVLALAEAFVRLRRV